MKAYTKIKYISKHGYLPTALELMYMSGTGMFYCWANCDLRAYNLYEVKPYHDVDIRLHNDGKIWGDL